MTSAGADWDPQPIPRSAILPLAWLAAREFAVAAPLGWLLPRRFPASVTAAVLFPQHAAQILAARRTGIAYTDPRHRSLLLAAPQQAPAWAASLLPLLALIAPAMLTLGGHRPSLPGRAAP